jgi:hypothetical protein
MKEKVTPLFVVEEVKCNDGKVRKIGIYGELTESHLITGYAPVTFTRKGRKIVSTGEPIIVDKPLRSPVKTFNMGWTICDERDEFSEEHLFKEGKKRFAKSPMTTQNGNFLTKDMVHAIMENEIVYISNHIEKFINKFKKKK